MNQDSNCNFQTKIVKNGHRDAVEVSRTKPSCLCRRRVVGSIVFGSVSSQCTAQRRRGRRGGARATLSPIQELVYHSLLAACLLTSLYGGKMQAWCFCIQLRQWKLVKASSSSVVVCCKVGRSRTVPKESMGKRASLPTYFSLLADFRLLPWRLASACLLLYVIHLYEALNVAQSFYSKHAHFSSYTYLDGYIVIKDTFCTVWWNVW